MTKHRTTEKTPNLDLLLCKISENYSCKNKIVLVNLACGNSEKLVL
jgi:hypothetical protein